MAAKAIPVVGQRFLGDDPAVVKAVKVILGGELVTAANVNATAVTTAQVLELFDVAAGVRVVEMTKQNTTKWFADVNISVGDTDAASGFFVSTAVAATVSDAAPVKNDANTTGSYLGGRVYSASQAINATVQTAAAASDYETGATEFILYYIENLDN
jgi:hypothetical protein